MQTLSAPCLTHSLSGSLAARNPCLFCTPIFQLIQQQALGIPIHRGPAGDLLTGTITADTTSFNRIHLTNADAGRWYFFCHLMPALLSVVRVRQRRCHLYPVLIQHLPQHNLQQIYGPLQTLQYHLRSTAYYHDLQYRQLI